MQTITGRPTLTVTQLREMEQGAMLLVSTPPMYLHALRQLVYNTGQRSGMLFSTDYDAEHSTLRIRRVS